MNLSDRAYRKVIENVETQFAFIRYCLRTMAASKQKAFFNQCRQKGEADWAKRKAEWNKLMTPENIAKLKKMGLPPSLVNYYHDEENKKTAKRMVRDQFDLKRVEKDPRRALDIWIGRSEASINQSELLLLVAHFESFMKVIHETFLQTCAEKVFAVKYRGRENVEFSVKKMFVGGSTAKFRNELIIKEVAWLDRQKIHVRIDYFKEHFGVLFGFDKDVKELTRLMDKRNQISHLIFQQSGKAREGGMNPEAIEKMKPEAIDDLPIVTEEDLESARRIFRSIPWECVRIGAKKFPNYFVWE